MLNTAKQLKSFMKSAEKDGRRAMSALRMFRYSFKDSEFHLQKSPLVKVIDKIIKQTGWEPKVAVRAVAEGHTTAPMCKWCDKEPVAYYGFKLHKFCSRECAWKDPERTKNAQKTMLKKYGVANYVEVPDVRKKALKKAHSEESVKKRKATCLERYGCESSFGSPEVYKKTTKSLLSRFGSRASMVKATTKKRIATNVKRYGVEHHFKDPVILRKQQESAFGSKSLRIRGVRFDGLQGYEDRAIRYMVEQLDFDPNDIVAHPQKTFVWKDESGKEHTYHPDLKIRGKKHIIEVKSEWTLKGTQEARVANKLKRDAVLAAGYRFTFLVPTSNGDALWITRKN